MPNKSDDIELQDVLHWIVDHQDDTEAIDSFLKSSERRDNNGS